MLSFEHVEKLLNFELLIGRSKCALHWRPMAPKAKAKTAPKKEVQTAGENGASTSQPPVNARRRDGTDPNDPVRIYADGKL